MKNWEKKTATSIKDVFASVFSNRSQTLALLLSGLLMMGHFVIIPFINPYMEFNVGFTKDQTPLIYMVGGVCAMASSTFIGKLADRLGKLKVFTVCLLLSLLPIFFDHQYAVYSVLLCINCIRFLVYFFYRPKYSCPSHDQHCGEPGAKRTVHEF